LVKQSNRPRIEKEKESKGKRSKNVVLEKKARQQFDGNFNDRNEFPKQKKFCN